MNLELLAIAFYGYTTNKMYGITPVITKTVDIQSHMSEVIKEISKSGVTSALKAISIQSEISIAII